MSLTNSESRLHFNRNFYPCMPFTAYNLSRTSKRKVLTVKLALKLKAVKNHEGYI